MKTCKFRMAGSILVLSVVAVLLGGCAEDGEGRPYWIAGTVVDSTSAIPLDDVQIHLDERFLGTTNDEGYYSVPLTVGTPPEGVLRFELPDYRAKEFLVPTQVTVDPVGGGYFRDVELARGEQ